MTTNSKIRIFKRSKPEIIIGKYSNIILFAVWLLFLIYETLFKSSSSHTNVALTVVLPILLAICIFNTLLFWKFAYQITFDLEKMKVTFFMFKRKKPIQVDINEIRQFLMSLYVIVSYGNKKIYFKGYDDIKLIDFLERNALPVKWNRAGRFLTKNMKKVN